MFLSAKILRSSLFVAAVGIAVVACGDDDDSSPPIDSGPESGTGGRGGSGGSGGRAGSGPRAGSGGSAGRDSGVDAGPETIKCGDDSCSSVMVQTSELTACCAGEDKDKCGLDVAALRNSGSTISGCFEREARADAPLSDHCALFFDQVDDRPGDDPESDGLYTTYTTLTGSKFANGFAGCCTEEGLCGIVLNSPVESELTFEVNLHLGCISFIELSARMVALPGTTLPPPPDSSTFTYLPYCDPDKDGAPAACPPTLGEAGCERLVASGFDCDPVAPTPDWVCQQRGLPKIGEDDPPTVTCMAGVPEYVRGCGAPTGERCVPNIPADVFGCKEVTTPVPGLPPFACGCGDGVVAAGCIPKVPATVCGAADAEVDDKDTSSANDDCIIGAPEYARGCGLDVEPTATNRCLRDTPVLFGCDDVATGTVANVPEFVCGCGDGIPDPGTGLPCLSNVVATVCGAVEVAAGSPFLATVPEYICGAEGAAAANAFPKLTNVASTVCGALEVTTGSASIATVGEFVCGCGAAELYDTEAFPCLSHVETTVCGALAVGASTDAAVATVPEYLCGCGETTLYNGTTFRCLSNVGTAICGGLSTDTVGHPALAGIPEYLCGCGDANPFDGEPFRCLSNVVDTTCGSLAVEANAPVLASIPEYLCGCGNGLLYENQSFRCLSNVPANACGTFAVTANLQAALDGIPEYLCGCGDGDLYDTESFRCLSNVIATVCGSVDITMANHSALVPIPEYLCGCGNATLTTGADSMPCLKNVVGTLCGALAVPAGLVPGYPNNLCGCGDATQGVGCLDNLPITQCGQVAVCSPAETVPVHGNCAGDVLVLCTDTNTDTVGDACVGP